MESEALESRALAPSLPEEPNRFIGREHELSYLPDTAAADPGADPVRRGRDRQDPAGAAVLAGRRGLRGRRLARRTGRPVGARPVVSRVAAALGVGEEPGGPLWTRWPSAATRAGAVVLLDNCEHLVDAVRRVGRAPARGLPGAADPGHQPGGAAVAGGNLWQVAAARRARPGARPDAGALAAIERSGCSRAGGGGPARASPSPSANARAVAADLPAPGRHAAGDRAGRRAGAVLPAEQIAARLDDRFGLLTGGDRTALPRQRTLRATIDWSYDLLSAPERVLLRRLSVFAGGGPWSGRAVCADDGFPAGRPRPARRAGGQVAGGGRPEVLGQARYRLLDSIREYAAAALADAGESRGIQPRLRDHTLGVASGTWSSAWPGSSPAGPAGVDVFRRYDADIGNVRQVLSGCLAAGDAETGLRMCAAVRPFWIVRGAFDEGENWCARFFSLGPEGVSRPGAGHGPHRARPARPAQRPARRASGPARPGAMPGRGPAGLDGHGAERAG